MNLMWEKALGYLLLAFGLVTIITATYNAFQVFTGKADPPQLFNQPGFSLDIKTLTQNLNPSVDSLPENNSQIDLLSSATINDLLNLTAYLILIGIISGAGFKVASLGIMLIRTIEVKLLESTPVRAADKIVQAGGVKPE